MTKKQELGEKGEREAQEYLKSKGYYILATNISNKYGEIDIIAGIKKTIVFLEIKTIAKKNSHEYEAEDHFNYRKRRALKKAISFEIEKGDWKNSEDIRVDLITLTYNNKNCIIKHYENVEL